MTRLDNNKEQKPKSSDNFDYHVRPWMVKFLPYDALLRDLVMFFVGFCIVFILGKLMIWLNWQTASLITSAVGYSHLLVHYFNRGLERWKNRSGTRSE